MTILHVGMLIYNNYNRYKTVYVTLQVKSSLVCTWWYFKKYHFEISSYKFQWYWALLLSSTILSYLLALIYLLNHWWTNFMACFLIFSNVGIAYRQSRWDGMGWNVAKKLWLGHHQSSHDTHTMAHAILVGHRGSGSYLRGPHHLIGALHQCHCSSHDFYESQQNAIQENTPVNI